jgi:hypothetical protein
VTPTQKLDRILAEGLTPDIHAIIDTKRYKYVRASKQSIRCGDWVVAIMYALMSDGTSCVPDRLPPAWWAHDRLYVSPWAYYKGVRKRLSRVRCDLIYAKIGLQYKNPIVIAEGWALACGLGRRAWKKHRSIDEVENIALHLVPKPMCWDFPTQFLREAEWVGIRY